MATRLELHSVLEDMLGSSNVYYQPPASIKMKYPAIVYHIQQRESFRANDNRYIGLKNYKITVISVSPDNEAIELILGLPYATFDTHYVADGLNHDVLSLYY